MLVFMADFSTHIQKYQKLGSNLFLYFSQTTARSWPFVDQWKILKEFVDNSDKTVFDVLYR